MRLAGAGAGAGPGADTGAATGPSARAVPRARPTATRTAVALAPVAAVAAASLWWPEHSDQALFDVGAQQLANGSVYDRDFWDVKQPGVYWFHELGEVLVPGGLGARLLEAGLAVVGGWLVLRIVAGWGLRPGVRTAAPALVMVPYLFAAFRDGVGQIESLMVVLQLAVLAGTWPDRGPWAGRRAAARALRPERAWFAAGLAIGAVTLLKTMYLPIPLLLVAVAAGLSGRIDRRGTLRRLLAAAAGALLVVVPAVVYLAAKGALGTALVTTFVLPFRIATQADLHPGFAVTLLARGLLDVASLTAPLALVALLTARGRGTLVRDGTLTAVIGVSAVLGLVQLWTPYRFLLLAAPLGLLAVAGADALAARAEALRGRAGGALVRPVLVAVAAVLAVPPLLGPLGMARGGMPLGLDLASRVARAEPSPSVGARHVAALIGGRAAPGAPVVVLGDPLVLRLLQARQGTEVIGQSLWLMPDVIWCELARELERSRPPLLYVGAGDGAGIAARATPGATALSDVLARRYRPLIGDPDGTWYAATAPGPGLPSPDGVRLP